MFKPVPPTGDAKEITALRLRLRAAVGYCQMLTKAFDALLHHGVNFRTLREYQDTSRLDAAEKLAPERAADEVNTWMERVTNALTAAVRRKSLKTIH